MIFSVSPFSRIDRLIAVSVLASLAGMIPTSAGGASLYGRDINHDMDEIRTFMGVCPQHDVLFDDLTVYEHLEFFGKLKGILLGDLHRAVMAAIEEVQLRPKMTTHAASLSGGQRRRLSLAIALIGDSKIVFLSVGRCAHHDRASSEVEERTAVLWMLTCVDVCFLCARSSLHPVMSLRVVWIRSVDVRSGIF